MGHPAADRACFSGDGSHCLDGLQFITILKARNLGGIKGSGLIGLAPTPDTAAERQSLAQPLTGAAPGFLSQLLHSPAFKRDFDPIFSFYLTKDLDAKGKIIFGGYDLKYAKQGSTEADVFWAKQSANPSYWGVNSSGVNLGQTKVAAKPQQVILDSGMSLAFAPPNSFKSLLSSIMTSTGIKCMDAKPAAACLCTEKQYSKLPNLEFNIVADETGKQKTVKMPKEAYMEYKADKNLVRCFLLISPQDFSGMGAKSKDEEYWVLGVQFLKNYYTMYDFQQKKIGLVESKTSVLA